MQRVARSKMHISTLLSLPSTVLLLLYAAPVVNASQQWPHNLPKHLKYFPEDERHVKRGLDIKERLQHERPVGMKKMSTDEGEMFMLDNWIFASSQSKRSDFEDFGNGTYQAQPAIRPNAQEEWFERLRIRDVLLKRQFRCPEGTLSCSSIGAPDVCCGATSTCVTVQDTNIGSVGCCPNGQACSGTISCNEAAGYTSCPNSSNGGCCLPGFQCSGVGCKFTNNTLPNLAFLIINRYCCWDFHYLRAAINICTSIILIYHSRRGSHTWIELRHINNFVYP